MLRPKSSVRYRMGGAHCGMCEYFVEGEGEAGTCKMVSGTIGEDMLCDLYKPKGDTQESAGPSPRPSFAKKANVY